MIIIAHDTVVDGDGCSGASALAAVAKQKAAINLVMLEFSVSVGDGL